MIPALPLRTSPIDRVVGPQEASPNTPGSSTEPADASPMESSTVDGALSYGEFTAALKNALRDYHRPDLLARNPLLRNPVGNPDEPSAPLDLKRVLSEAVARLFDNPRDDKLRRVIELTYFQPGLKQEAVADRLGMSFGTYRRYLTAARDRLLQWLWEKSQAPPRRPRQSSVVNPAAIGAGLGDRPAASNVDDTAAPRLSLIILPFVHIGNADDDQFAVGITEILTTDLSRSPGYFIISRSTASAYGGKAVDVRQIGRDVGVRYVLEGSVQHAGELIRINAQLLDAESGAHLWAERFDARRTDLLQTEDEIAARLTRSIEIELIAADSQRAVRGHPDGLDAFDYVLLGWAAWNRHHLSLLAARQAREFFEAALRLDRRNDSALMGLATSLMWEVNMYASDARDAHIRTAEAAAVEALALRPDSASAHVTYGCVLFGMRAPERALREFELAVKLDPKLASAHGYLALMKFFLGRAGETRGHVEKAMRLSPRDPLLFHWLFFIGVADVYLRRVVRGLESLRKSVEINPNWALSQFVLAGALALAGLLAEAADACAAGRRLAPNFTIAKFRGEAVSDSPVYLAQREHFYQGLRLAGVPEE